MKMRDMYGAVTMEVSSVERRGDTILAKGKAFGSMPMTVHVKPQDMWEGKKLMSWSLLWYLPIMIVKGWWRCRRSQTKATGASGQKE